jgi:parallel beta-helix repeat protein
MNAQHLFWGLTAAALVTAASVGAQIGPEQSSMTATYVKCGEDGPGDRRLQRAIDTSLPGGSIVVSGTCHENVAIPWGKDGITLDGGGTAAITAVDPTRAAVLVNAKNTTVRAFTITGGLGGVVVTQGGTGRVDGNTIRDSGAYGVSVSQLSSAVIVNNTIQNHRQAGIGVAETSYAFIGFVNSTDSVAGRNVITGNRAQGIAVFRGSYARIVGNDISDNGANGVNVRESSSAQISDNTVNGNGMNGILVAQGSGVLTGIVVLSRINQSLTVEVPSLCVRCSVSNDRVGCSRHRPSGTLRLRPLLEL